MTQTAETVLKSALQLPEDQRAEIADILYESLWNTKLSDADAAAWEAFIEERLAAVDRGDFAPGTPFDAIEEIRREIRQEAK
jgi:hypothetical protein